MKSDRGQREAILHGEGACQVLAGPGSGKTRTIVDRVCHLVGEQSVRPEEILIVTFTRYAAAEMKSRLHARMGEKAAPVTAGTFHGIYYGILKQTYRIGQENILSEEEKYRILREVLSDRQSPGADDDDFLRETAGEIGRAKNGRIPPEEFHSRTNPASFADIFREYEAKRKALRKIDLDDMLVLCCGLFLSRPDILEQWQKKFRYILVDEFQDINRVQYDVIRMLALPENNLFVVGDDDQAIYGFRGAEPEFMFRFLQDYPGAARVILGKNYRSTGNIVRNSLKVIGHNRHRFQKKLQAVKDRGECLHIQEVKDVHEEAAYVADEIEKALAGGLPAEEMAVLFRLHTDGRAVAEELTDRHIPFYIRESLPNLYGHFIAKDMLSYLRLASETGTRGDFLRVMNRPVRYIARDSLSGEQASFEAIRNFYSDREWMLDRIDQFEWDVRMLSRMAPYAAVRYIRKKAGYDDFLRDYANENGKEYAPLREVCDAVEEAAKPYASAEDWFSHIREYTDRLREQSRRRQASGEGVRLMTLHAAKGLEFHTVFLTGANEGGIPCKKSLSDAGEKGLEEERRLFYVGMTRASERLVVSYVKTKNGKEVSPSRFIGELLEE